MFINEKLWVPRRGKKKTWIQAAWNVSDFSFCTSTEIYYLYTNERINFFCSLHLHGNDPFWAASRGRVWFLLVLDTVQHKTKKKVYANVFPLPTAVLSELRLEKKTVKRASTPGVCCFTTHDGEFHTRSSCHMRVEESPDLSERKLSQCICN